MGFLYACALALLIFSNPTINAESQPPIGFQVNILIQSPKNKQTTKKKLNIFNQKGTRGRRSISPLDDEVKNENYSNIYQNIEAVSTTSTPDGFNDGGDSHIRFVFCFNFF